MNWITTKNNLRINALDIPTISLEQLKEELRLRKFRVLGFFGKQEFANVRLYVIISTRGTDDIFVTSVIFTPDVKSYESLTPEFSQFHIYEREFYEDFGIEPINHPWLKPVRKNQNSYSGRRRYI